MVVRYEDLIGLGGGSDTAVQQATLRSIYQSFGGFDLATSRDPLVIEWSPPPGGAVSVQADGWVGGEPYRMDIDPGTGRIEVRCLGADGRAGTADDIQRVTVPR